MRRLCLTVTLGTAAAVLIAATNVFAQESNPRFGVWKLDSSGPPPSNNIMTYEPFEDFGGMLVSVREFTKNGRQNGHGARSARPGEEAGS